MKAYQEVIIKRFIKGKDFESFESQYKDARLLSRGVSKPSQNDQRMAQSLKQTKSVAYVAKTFKVSSYYVYSALARVEAWNK